MRTPSLISSLALVATIVLSLAVGGCASGGPRGRGSGDYVKSFEGGRYAEAYELASKASQQGSGFKRDQASLIAGLSAQALNRNTDAEKFLEPLVTNGDPKIAAEASAALGLVYAETGKHDKAVELLAKAGRGLEADQAARAFMYAGDSYKSLGKATEARGMWSLAQTKVTNDAALRTMIGDRLSAATNPPPVPPTVAKPAKGSSQYTVQVGAFSNFTNAQKQLARFRAYGSPRVVEITRSGKKLFVVRVGAYGNRADADRVAKNIGAEAKVMPMTDE